MINKETIVSLISDQRPSEIDNVADEVLEVCYETIMAQVSLQNKLEAIKKRARGPEIILPSKSDKVEKSDTPKKREEGTIEEPKKKVKETPKEIPNIERKYKEKRGRWTKEEETLFEEQVSKQDGNINWEEISEQIEGRSAKSCEKHYMKSKEKKREQDLKEAQEKVEILRPIAQKAK